MPTSRTCDIFCTVIDNYGDAAVSARLARQLVAEHGWTVRLWLDDWRPLAALWPEADLHQPVPLAHGVSIHAWSDMKFPDDDPAEVVISAFGCRLPNEFMHRMVSHTDHWLNLEYLSAESWVEHCHRLPSPHPQLALTQHFFFPGFTAQTGGLLREDGLLAERDRWLATPSAQQAFWQQLGVTPPSDAIKVSLFGYADAPLLDLLSAWNTGEQSICCLLPHDQLTPTALAWQAKHPNAKLQLHPLPFLAQADYDRLLWACDINFVRGEDSLVRALWAGRPFVWHIYPQDEQAHLVKLQAFLDLLPELHPAISALYHAWNQPQLSATDSLPFLQHLAAIRTIFRQFCHQQRTFPDLATQLVKFCEIG